MAALTMAAVTAGVAVAGGVAKGISGAKQKRDATRAARQFRRQELNNVQDSRRVSTMGADLAMEANARNAATTTEALRTGGVRGVVGGAAGVVAAGNDNARTIGADLDRQRVGIDREQASDEARMRDMRESRDSQELNALQQQVNAGNEQMWGGIGDMASGIGGFATAGLDAKKALGGNAIEGFGKSSKFLNDFRPPSVFSNYVNPLTKKPLGG